MCLGFSNEPEPVPPMDAYPSAADAANARRVGNWYGSPLASFTSGASANVYGPGGHPQSGVGNFFDDLLNPENALRIVPNERLNLDDYYGRAALAANRIPVAALGFDPSKMSVDILTDPHEVNTMGAYSPTTDHMFAIAGQDSDSASTPVHESIHRGLDILRQSGQMPENETYYNGDEEHLVRAIMQGMAGDPEQGEVARQMKKNNSLTWRPDKFIDAINVASSVVLRSKERKMGPR